LDQLTAAVQSIPRHKENGLVTVNAGLTHRWTIFILTCRGPDTDFRAPLAYELQRLGHEVFYVYVKAKPVITRLRDGNSGAQVSLPEFVGFFIRHCRMAERCLVFNSTNLVFPVSSVLLRVLAGGIWCFDIHDDLLYDANGLRRFTAEISQRILYLTSDFCVHAAVSLGELFPSSYHLGNASALTRARRNSNEFTKILILASIDSRFDFEFFDAAAQLCRDTKFDVYGQLTDDRSTTERFNTIVRNRVNVAYHGPYVVRDLPDLLERYSVTLAPYKTNVRRTRYLDPLRYYHCLNAGMEVVSTDIPQANILSDVLHIVKSPQDVEELIGRLKSDPTIYKNIGLDTPIVTWSMRARRLMEILAHATQSAE
jgi:hypothetical protein